MGCYMWGHSAMTPPVAVQSQPTGYALIQGIETQTFAFGKVKPYIIAILKYFCPLVYSEIL